MSTAINTIVKLIEKHTGDNIKEETIKGNDTGSMKSAIEAILQKIETRAGSSESIRKMAVQVRQAIQ
jgi:hypothetical protein